MDTLADACFPLVFARSPMAGASADLFRHHGDDDSSDRSQQHSGSGGSSSGGSDSGFVSQWGGSGGSGGGGGFCQGLNMFPTYHMEGGWLTGTVTININININTFNTRNVRIKIVIFNGRGFTPMWTWAQCGTGGFSNGQMQCFYRTRLPQSGPASNPSFWTGMQAYGFFDNNQCSSNMMPLAFGGQ
jgi:hypothetical protein